MEGKMKDRNRKYVTIVFNLFFLLSLSCHLNAQNKNVSQDVNAQKEQTLGVKADNNQTSSGDNAQEKKDVQQQSDKNKKKKEEGLAKVKQVKGSGPDMLRARGARPPYIVSPSGAKMPKGAGKPGGAMRTGRR